MDAVAPKELSARIPFFDCTGGVSSSAALTVDADEKVAVVHGGAEFVNTLFFAGSMTRPTHLHSLYCAFALLLLRC